jgi:hypothetical protein
MTQYQRCPRDEEAEAGDAGVETCCPSHSRPPNQRVSFAWRAGPEPCSSAEGPRRGQLLRRVSLGLATVAMAALCASLFREQSRRPASDLQLAGRGARLSATDRAKAEAARAIRAGYLRAGFSASRADALTEAPTGTSERTRAHPVPTKLDLDRRPLEVEVSEKHPRPLHKPPNSTRTTALYRSKRGSFDPRTGPMTANC